ncbi:cyclopropane fatty acyl phospholipid synthase [Vulcaniibacterium gelatinicum]|uniref:cyclopropane fatty acyl phospholipid synthase n=1 Tax=Vulcaniibacterium gelatinicum TaxID=2598725 RepID=UPI0011C7BA03|nr:cyclopropane fatty acyl phospholipid synthase [Vulcaniibacterium gelatinicum]
MGQGLRGRVERLLEAADVRIGGDRPWDIAVHDARFYARVLLQGSLGLGESYMDGWWDAGSLDGFLFRLLDARLDERARGLADLVDGVRARLQNLQSRRRAFTIGQRHYDLGNDLYEAMLGRRLVYSCGYWRHADTLDAAQEAKLDLVCRKLGLQPGMHVLDIGCGWGEALKFAAERYGVSGVGITVSREQAEYARRLCAGLPVEIRLQDYRALEGRFDRVFSIGMFEHVGVKNYPVYFEVARRCLAGDGPDDGLFLLHTIGGNRSCAHTDPWIARYIFPNSMLPSAAQIAAAVEGRFVIEDWHNFGADYDRTLQAWRANVEAAWQRLPPRYDERFRRMWRFYLAGAMASFRARRIQLWQVVLSPRGVPGGYLAPR